MYVNVQRGRWIIITAQRLKNAGAASLVLFNLFYQPDFDISNLSIKIDLQFSESCEINLPLL